MLSNRLAHSSDALEKELYRIVDSNNKEALQLKADICEKIADFYSGYGMKAYDLLHADSYYARAIRYLDDLDIKQNRQKGNLFMSRLAIHKKLYTLTFELKYKQFIRELIFVENLVEYPIPEISAAAKDYMRAFLITFPGVPQPGHPSPTPVSTQRPRA